MTSERVQLVGVGRGEQRFAVFFRDSDGAPVQIEEAFVKMTHFDRVETIDLVQQPPSDRPSQNKKWMRRNREHRSSPTRAKLPKIFKILERGHFCGGHVQQNYIGALQPYFSGGNEQNSHARGIGEHFGAIEHRVVQSDCENAEAELFGALQKLVRRVIDDVFRIIERMNMKIDLDPIGFARAHALTHARNRTSSGIEHEQEHDYEHELATCQAAGSAANFARSTRTCSGGGMADTYV